MTLDLTEQRSGTVRRGQVVPDAANGAQERADTKFSRVELKGARPAAADSVKTCQRAFFGGFFEVWSSVVTRARPPWPPQTVSMPPCAVLNMLHHRWPKQTGRTCENAQNIH